MSAAGTDKASNTVGYAAYYTIAWAGYRAKGQILPSADDCSASLGELSFGLYQTVVGSLKVVVAYDILFVEFQTVLIGELSGGECCLGCVHGGYGLIDGFPVGHVVDGEEYLASVYNAALVYEYFGDKA